MSSTTTQRWYSIKEAAALTGLPASTLRYYESNGIIRPVSRGATSGHRAYSETDLDELMWVACLAATGMSMADMRQYVANGQLGPEAADDQIRLLRDQQEHLAAEARQLKLRRRYVEVKLAYWQAIEARDQDRVDEVAAEARRLADELRDSRQHNAR